MAGPPGAGSGGSGGGATLKAYFKMPEGRYKCSTRRRTPQCRTTDTAAGPSPRYGTAGNCGERAACGGSPFSGGSGPVVMLTLYGWAVVGRV
jgi:hypothetical protein